MSDPFELAEQLQSALDETSVELLAERMGKSVQWVRNQRQLRNLHPGLKKLVRERKLPLQYATQLAYKTPERQLAKVQSLFPELNIERPENSIHQMSLHVTEVKGPRLVNLIELIGRPIAMHSEAGGATATWRFEDPNQLVRAVGYAHRIGLLGELPNTVRAEVR